MLQRRTRALCLTALLCTAGAAGDAHEAFPFDQLLVELQLDVISRAPGAASSWGQQGLAGPDAAVRYHAQPGHAPAALICSTILLAWAALFPWGPPPVAAA